MIAGLASPPRCDADKQAREPAHPPWRPTIPIWLHVHSPSRRPPARSCLGTEASYFEQLGDGGTSWTTGAISGFDRDDCGFGRLSAIEPVPSPRRPEIPTWLHAPSFYKVLHTLMAGCGGLVLYSVGCRRAARNAHSPRTCSLRAATTGTTNVASGGSAALGLFGDALSASRSGGRRRWRKRGGGSGGCTGSVGGGGGGVDDAGVSYTDRAEHERTERHHGRLPEPLSVPSGGIAKHYLPFGKPTLCKDRGTR